MIELRHLRAFRAIMRQGSTVEAAATLGVSQPSISRLLSELEAARGEPLFIRANGRLSPRHTAEMLLPEVESALDKIDQMASGAAHGTPLLVAAPGGIVTAILAPACRRLKADFPDLRLSAEIMSYHETLNAVAMGRVDAGLVKAPVDHPAVESVALVTVGTEVVMPVGHRLGGKDMIRATDLFQEPLVLLGRQRPFRIQLEQIFARAGVTPMIAVETQAVSAACAFVAQGFGITIANALLSRSESGNGLMSRPFDAGIEHSFCLIHASPPSRPSLMAALVKHVQDVVSAALSAEGAEHASGDNLA